MESKSGEIISTLLQLANQCGKSPAQLALAWVLSHLEVTVAITGGDTTSHLDDNIGSVGWTLDGEIRQKLDSVSEIQSEAWS